MSSPNVELINIYLQFIESAVNEVTAQLAVITKYQHEILRLANGVDEFSDRVRSTRSEDSIQDSKTPHKGDGYTV